MKTTADYIKLLRRYKAEKAAGYGIREMGIFGSVARGEQKDDSDIDIYIEGEAQGLFTMARIKNELEELFGCKVDLIRLRDRMNSFLKQRILKEGIYV